MLCPLWQTVMAVPKTGWPRCDQAFGWSLTAALPNEYTFSANVADSDAADDVAVVVHLLLLH